MGPRGVVGAPVARCGTVRDGEEELFEIEMCR